MLCIELVALLVLCEIQKYSNTSLVITYTACPLQDSQTLSFSLLLGLFNTPEKNNRMTDVQEEDGYTILNHPYQNPMNIDIRPCNNQGLSAPVFTWRPVALTLFTLCLVLVIGLMAMFFHVSKTYKEGRWMQEMREHLCLEGEEHNKNNGPICTLCPTNWQWAGGNTCFYISNRKETWQHSQEFCSSQNATLFMLKEKKNLEYVPQIDKKQYYWIGLSYKPDGWFWVDNTALSTKRRDWIVLSYSENCAYLYYHHLKVYNSKNCNVKYPWICEKAAVQMT